MWSTATMVLRPTSANQHPELENHFERRLFTRRHDLTAAIRLAIASDALHAMMSRAWGTITDLADHYGISRPFVYSLANTLKEAGTYLFEEAKGLVSFLSPRELAIQMMLSLRLEGRSSIGAISTIMDRFGHPLSSTGSISQIQSRIGGLLPMTISAEPNVTLAVVFASDEIFSKSVPILVTVDPGSSAILRIELADSRTGEEWKNHFVCLQDNGMEAIYLVSDEGQGLLAGHAEALSDVVRQSDTYHAIAHQLGSWADRLEKAAYKAIDAEHDREKKLNSAKSMRVQNKRLRQWEECAETAEKAVSRYDDFIYLYYYLLAQINVFDSNGHLRSRQQAEEGVQVALALIAELGHNPLTEAASKVKRTLPDLFHYFDVAKEVVAECAALGIDEEVLKSYCIAWQWGKAAEKTKTAAGKRKAREQAQFCADIAAGLHQDESRDIQKEVYSRLDGIVQSSALVECINSIIRPYLNTTKNHVTQDLLNLIMHYHNHRRYCDGKRKGKTPMEILTGREQAKDWMAILFDLIREKDPELLFAS